VAGPFRAGSSSPQKTATSSPAARPACIASTRKTGEFKLLERLNRKPGNNRLNDGYVDGAGYLWFGSMDDDEKTRPARSSSSPTAAAKSATTTM